MWFRFWKVGFDEDSEVFAGVLRFFEGEFHGRLEHGVVVTWLSQHHEKVIQKKEEKQEERKEMQLVASKELEEEFKDTGDRLSED